MTFSVSGTDLSISASGVLTFNVAPDYETQSSYAATVTVTDGTNSVTQLVTISVLDVNEVPIFNSLSSFNVAENQADVGMVSATDPEGDTLTFSVSGSDLSITSTGELTFVSLPDYETQSSYSATVTVVDGSNTTNQSITVTLIDINEAPVFTSLSSFSVVENQTSVGRVQATDPEGRDLTFSTTGTEISVTPAGVLTFNSAPDYEVQSSYSTSVDVNDGVNNSTQGITVSITDIDDTSPRFTSNAIFTVPENRLTVGTVTATDPDSSSITFTVSGTELEITSSGMLSFKLAPDYSVKSSYSAIVTATDGTNASSQDITVNIAETSELNSIDIDGNNDFDALTDGLLVLRSMFGLSGDALTTGTVSSNAIFSTSEEIQSRYSSIEGSLDIDADGNIDALTDGLLVLRYLFGLRGDTLITGVISPNAVRSSASDIEQYLSNLTSDGS